MSEFTETQRKRRGHAFLPPENILAKIPRLYGAEKDDDPVVWLHYFCASGDWWVTEVDQRNWEAFGYAKLAAFPGGAEWGYIDLEELEELNVHHGLVIVERDCYWTPVKFSKIKETK
jgi:hypothetical protein